MMPSFRAMAMPPAALLLLLVVVHISSLFAYSLLLQQPTPPLGLLPPNKKSYRGGRNNIINSGSGRRNHQLLVLKHSTPLKSLSAYSVSDGTAKESSKPSSWRTATNLWKLLPTPLEKLATEFGLLNKGKLEMGPTT